MRISSSSTRHIIGEKIQINGPGCSSIFEFTDGDCVLLPYSKDLSSSIQFDEFIHTEPQLFPLRFNSNDASKRTTVLKRQPITSVNLGDTFFLGYS